MEIVENFAPTLNIDNMFIDELARFVDGQLVILNTFGYETEFTICEWDEEVPITEPVECPKCEGTGEYELLDDVDLCWVDMLCDLCGGSGDYEEETIEVVKYREVIEYTNFLI